LETELSKLRMTLKRQALASAIRDQGLAADYYALANRLRACGDLERAGAWQGVAASYASAAMNNLTRLVNHDYD
jgi:hypothetical protein